jgi:hypothetical protein
VRFPNLIHLSSTHFCSPTWLTSLLGCHTSQLRDSHYQLSNAILTRSLWAISRITQRSTNLYQSSTLLSLELPCLRCDFPVTERDPTSYRNSQILHEEYQSSTLLLVQSSNKKCLPMRLVRRPMSLPYNPLMHNFSLVPFNNLEGLSLLSFDDFNSLRKKLLHTFLMDESSNTSKC